MNQLVNQATTIGKSLDKSLDESNGLSNDLSDIKIEINIYLQDFGVTLSSPLVLPLLRSQQFPVDGTLTWFTDQQLYDLAELLESRWESLPTLVKGKRIILSHLLKQCRQSWDSPHMIEWIKMQRTPFTALTFTQLTELEQKLKLLLKK